MEILSHRGYWQKKEEKNSLQAFTKALDFDFGIETDLRDHLGEIVISHDIPRKDEKCITFENFLALYNDKKSESLLALNIKADGLAEKVSRSLVKYQIKNYFAFDMSIPDHLQYNKLGTNVYCRSSEYENYNLMKKKSRGLWVDGFSEKYYKNINIEECLEDFEEIAIVSPDLHGLEYADLWARLKRKINFNSRKKISLCTDYPLKAHEYFNN